MWYVILKIFTATIGCHYLILPVLQEPVRKVLGYRPQPDKVLKDGSVKIKKDQMVYIPILKTIQRLLQNDRVLSEVS